MKKMVCLILAVCCVAGALIGCGSGEAGLTDLTEEDFMPYQNGEPVKELMEESDSTYSVEITEENDQGYETSRGIKLGSTFEEVLEAYPNIQEWSVIDDTTNMNVETKNREYLVELLEQLEQGMRNIESLGLTCVEENGKYYAMCNEEFAKWYNEKYKENTDKLWSIGSTHLNIFFDDNAKVEELHISIRKI